jgi:hypothetical protein
MAQQNRLERRQCGADLHYVLSRDEPRGVFTRIHMNGSPPKRAFVFLAAKRHADMSYEEYRKSRMHYLTTYCHAIKGSMPTLQEAIGVSAEPFSEGESSFEFIYVDHSMPMSDEEKKGWRDMADELEILRPKTQFAFYKDTAKEFPIPFDFGPESHTPPMSRAQRRRVEREARKIFKKRKRRAGPRMRGRRPGRRGLHTGTAPNSRLWPIETREDSSSSHLLPGQV